jgi:hypothetical protein
VMKKADLNNLPYTLVQVVCKKWLKEVLWIFQIQLLLKK